ncbi:MAG: hypothetical protein ABIV50_04860 [Opitutus sp.]
MKSKTVSLCLILAASVGILVLRSGAQSSAKTAAPETAKVVFENDRSRVIEYHTNTGKDICGLGLHSHPAHLYIMLTDSKLRTIGTDGKEEIVDSKAGEVGWEAASTHRCENLLGNNAGVYVIEIKDKDWRPSTGLTQ